MYYSFQQLREGWTKNLALLFPHPRWLALKTLFFWGLPWLVLLWPVAVLFIANVRPHWLWIMVFCLAGMRNLMRLQRSNFDLKMEFLGAIFGMPTFAYLLLRSQHAHACRSVSWKGRTYEGKQPPRDGNLQDHPVTRRFS